MSRNVNDLSAIDANYERAPSKLSELRATHTHTTPHANNLHESMLPSARDKKTRGRPGRFDPSTPLHMTTRRPTRIGTVNGTSSASVSADNEDTPGYTHVSIDDINEKMKKEAKELDAREEVLVKREIEVKKQEEKTAVKFDPVSGLALENIGASVTQEDMAGLFKTNENQMHTIFVMEKRVYKPEDEKEKMRYELGRAYKKINTLRETLEELEKIADVSSTGAEGDDETYTRPGLFESNFPVYKGKETRTQPGFYESNFPMLKGEKSSDSGKHEKDNVRMRPIAAMMFARFRIFGRPIFLYARGHGQCILVPRDQQHGGKRRLGWRHIDRYGGQQTRSHLSKAVGGGQGLLDRIKGTEAANQGEGAGACCGQQPDR